MSWDENVGYGWRAVVRQAVDDIKALGGKILEVKEKFGELRIYFTCPEVTMAQASAILSAAEAECARTCEHCHQPGELRMELRWAKTLCEEHLREAQGR